MFGVQSLFSTEFMSFHNSSVWKNGFSVQKFHHPAIFLFIIFFLIVFSVKVIILWLKRRLSELLWSLAHKFSLRIIWYTKVFRAIFLFIREWKTNLKWTKFGSQIFWRGLNLEYLTGFVHRIYSIWISISNSMGKSFSTFSKFQQFGQLKYCSAKFVLQVITHVYGQETSMKEFCSKFFKKTKVLALSNNFGNCSAEYYLTLEVIIIDPGFSWGP